MNNKWIVLPVLSIFFLTSGTAQVQAILSQDKFIPAYINNKITANDVYTVKKGDTLWDISRYFQVDINTVMTLNSLDKNSILSIGQKLKIPCNRTKVHIVSRGETMWDIASRYDVAISALKYANRDKNPCYLNIGDKLVIPDRKSIVLASRGISSRGAVKRYIFSWPLIGKITSRYGWRESGFHHGLDIAGNVGDPIRAAAAGKVCFAAYKSIYGRTVEINHANGYKTVYAHCNQLMVADGQTVAKGQVIATVGITGYTTGPHLHFEVRQDEKTYDPLKYLSK